MSYDDLWTYEHIRKPRPDLAEAVKSLPQDTLIVDCETQKSAKEVGGWKHIDKMGLSCAAGWRADRGIILYPTGGNARLVLDLLEAKAIAGHNIIRFDLTLLRPIINKARAWAMTQPPTNHLTRTLQAAKFRDADPLSGTLLIDTLKLLEESSGRKWALDSLALHTLNAGKCGTGLDAIKWYKEQNWRNLYAYVIQDVAVTRDLLLHGLTYGMVKAGEDLELKVDWKERLLKMKER